MSFQRLVIATRRSRLALWQAEHVQTRLRALNAGLAVELLPHSPRAREDPRDALVSNRYTALADMPSGAVVGTSSLRRAAQVLERHPALELRLLRGNVETRVAKLDRGEYDAIVLAVAGLVRLGLEGRIRSRLSLDDSLPAPGQGALGIECLAARSELVQLLAALGDAETARCVRAERAVSRALGGSCTLPLGAHAVMRDGRLSLSALVASADGRRVVRAHAEGSDPESVGAAAAQALREQGADAILQSGQ